MVLVQLKFCVAIRPFPVGAGEGKVPRNASMATQFDR